MAGSCGHDQFRDHDQFNPIKLDRCRGKQEQRRRQRERQPNSPKLGETASTKEKLCVCPWERPKLGKKQRREASTEANRRRLDDEDDEDEDDENNDEHIHTYTHKHVLITY